MKTAIELAEDKPSSIDDDLYAWATEAAAMLFQQAEQIEALTKERDARSAVHKHYLGQAMPDAVYQLFALVRDDVIPALAQQEQCGCREGECETKKDKTCRMTIEIAERDGILEWTPTIGIECAISSLRDDAARLRDGGYTPLQIADDLDVIANELGKCNPVVQQEQPASVDAYVGAREDAAIWKKRALEAEELNRKFIAELNGPTYLGEPVKQKQPAQKVSESWTDIVAVNLVREGVNKHKARELAAHFLTLFAPPTQQAKKPDLWKTQFLTDVMTSAGLLMYGRTDKKLAQRIADGSARWRTELYTHPAPTQPALSEEVVRAGFRQTDGYAEFKWMTSWQVWRAAVAWAEAHCRGGAGK